MNEYSSILNFEHFLYIPIVGILLFLLLIGRYYLALNGVEERTKGLIVVFLVLMCMILTIKQNIYWKSEVALFERTLKYQNSARVGILLGKAYYFESRYDRAILEYNRSLKTMQNYINLTQNGQIQNFYRGFIKGIYFDLAHCYEAMKDTEKAVKMYLSAIGLDSEDEILYNNLAVLYIRQQDYSKATQYLQIALDINPNSALTRQNLAYCYVQTGQKTRADQLLQQELDKP